MKPYPINTEQDSAHTDHLHLPFKVQVCLLVSFWQCIQVVKGQPVKQTHKKNILDQSQAFRHKAEDITALLSLMSSFSRIQHIETLL